MDFFPFGIKLHFAVPVSCLTCRAQKIMDICENEPGDKVCTTFTLTCKNRCVGDDWGGCQPPTSPQNHPNLLLVSPGSTATTIPATVAPEFFLSMSMIVNPKNIHPKIHNPRMFYPQSYAEMTFVAGTAGGACLTRRSRQVREMTTLIKYTWNCILHVLF